VPDDGDAQFQEYATARMGALRRLAFLICGDWHLAEDAVSAALTKAYLAWTKIRSVEHVDAYVRRILIRAIIDERRRPWRRESPARYPMPGTVTAATDHLDDRIVLTEALLRLPPRRRAVLVLRYFEGLNVEETAIAMGSSAGTVKSQTARALAALRELLPADYLLPDGGAR
jgi:RNA polymerase sigma-70 factor (sigma-E family)